MTHRIFSGVGILAAGAVVAALLYWATLQIESQSVPPQPSHETATLSTGLVNTISPQTTNHVEALEEELNHYREWAFQLENQVIELESRLSVLEEVVTASATDQSTLAVPVSDDAAEDSNDPSQKNNGTLNVTTLVDSGIDPQLAAEIVQRKNDLDMRQLELRDQAIRDGTFRKKEYFMALRELNEEAPDLRAEVGDDVYDRYLYAMGQSNRVVVTSLIPGSSAEQAGILNDDIILVYDNKRIFKWSELRDATSQGELGEYIRVDIQRKTGQFSLLLPRGPLGVRMGSKSNDPAAD